MKSDSFISDCDDSFNSLVENSLAEQQLTPPPRYNYVKKIGQGGMASVFLAEDTKLNRLVAVKRVSCPTSKEANEAMLEVWPIRDVIHDNIVTYEDVFFEEDINSTTERYQMCIAMKYFADGDLSSNLARRLQINQHFDQMELLEYMQQLSSGLAHLHSKNIIHRDLKPLNIFQDGSILKIGDFGLCKNIEASTAHTKAGTPNYMSPDVFSSSSYTLKADVWSLGVCFLTMMNLSLNTTPYLEIYMNPNFLKDIQIQAKLLGYSEEIAHIIVRCLNVNASERPTASDIHMQITQLIDRPELLNPDLSLIRKLDFAQLIDIIIDPQIPVPTLSDALSDYKVKIEKWQDDPNFFEILKDEACFFETYKRSLEEGSDPLRHSLIVAMMYSMLGVQAFSCRAHSTKVIRHVIESGLLTVLQNHPCGEARNSATEFLSIAPSFSFMDPGLDSLVKQAQIQQETHKLK